MLDKDALSAARQAFDSSDMGHEYRLKAAITAYLSAATADVGGLVEHLGHIAHVLETINLPGAVPVCTEAAATLTALAAEKVRLEGDVERLREVHIVLADAQKEMILLQIVSRMGKNFDATESKWSFLNWFCDDNADGEDTFNRCIKKGWIDTSYNSDNDVATGWLTDEGRAALSAAKGGQDHG